MRILLILASTATLLLSNCDTCDHKLGNDFNLSPLRAIYEVTVDPSCPYVDFTLKGTVTSSPTDPATGAKIPGKPFPVNVSLRVMRDDCSVTNVEGVPADKVPTKKQPHGPCLLTFVFGFVSAEQKAITDLALTAELKAVRSEARCKYVGTTPPTNMNVEDPKNVFCQKP